MDIPAQSDQLFKFAFTEKIKQYGNDTRMAFKQYPKDT